MMSLVLLMAGTLAFGAELPIRPDHSKTPGDTVKVTVSQVCTPGYSSTVRNVPDARKRQVYASYGITPSGYMTTAKSGKRVRKSTYEIDHLISLELGGSNDAKNLWPESYLTTPWNAGKKDALENRLHWLVCHTGLPLKDVQAVIATDWIAGYKHFVEQNATK